MSTDTYWLVVAPAMMMLGLSGIGWPRLWVSRNHERRLAPAKIRSLR
jgi:hypothetical protein